MPMPNPFGTTEPASLGDMLGQQMANETEEMRKKRMLEQQQQRMTPTLGSVGQLLSGGLGKGSVSGFLGGFGGR